MSVPCVFLVTHGDEFFPLLKILGLYAQIPKALNMGLGKPLVQPSQKVAVLIGNPEIRCIKDEHDENEVRNNEFIEDPVLLRLAQPIETSQIPKPFVLEEVECGACCSLGQTSGGCIRHPSSDSNSVLSILLDLPAGGLLCKTSRAKRSDSSYPM